MQEAKNEKPIFDQRVEEILDGLSRNISRDQLAEEFGHKSYKTLDIYMRRRNFTWHREKLTYVPKRNANTAKAEKVLPTSKARRVIALMNEPNPNMDLIYSKAGFRDHRELAAYMTTKGYIWSSTDQNYKKKIGLMDNEREEAKETTEKDSLIEFNVMNVVPVKQLHLSMDQPTDLSDMMQQYGPLLQWLALNKEQIAKGFETEQPDTFPRYILPGKANGKTIQMSDALQDLAVTFCNERNIKQRELFEVALIECLGKYGYTHELANLMQDY